MLANLKEIMQKGMDVSEPVWIIGFPEKGHFNAKDLEAFSNKMTLIFLAQEISIYFCR